MRTSERTTETVIRTTHANSAIAVTLPLKNISPSVGTKLVKTGLYQALYR